MRQSANRLLRFATVVASCVVLTILAAEGASADDLFRSAAATAGANIPADSQWGP